MRSVTFAFTGILGLTAAALAANAAPAAPASDTPHNSNIVTVAAGCGPGYHPTPSGRCVPFRSDYDRPYERAYDRPYGRPYDYYRGY